MTNKLHQAVKMELTSRKLLYIQHVRWNTLIFIVILNYVALGSLKY